MVKEKKKRKRYAIILIKSLPLNDLSLSELQSMKIFYPRSFIKIDKKHKRIGLFYRSGLEQIGPMEWKKGNWKFKFVKTTYGPNLSIFSPIKERGRPWETSYSALELKDIASGRMKLAPRIPKFLQDDIIVLIRKILES